MDDKTRMLRSLAIERPQQVNSPPPRRRLWPAIGIAALVGLLGIGAALWFGLVPVVRAPAVEVRAAQPSEPDPAQQKPVAEPRQAGSLIASGYVVARRKATVAAEVTGKVVELLVEEGMVVQAGQVLAKLDDVLPAKDYALAESRVEASTAAVEAIAADLRDAERILNRIQTLSQKNFATDADLTKAQAKAAVLQAQLRQAEA